MHKIKAEELFFLGKLMNAQYIDYDYVALMDDIQQNYKQKERDITFGLMDKGILMEDFSGNIELDEEYTFLLKPVFFGQFESSMTLFHVENQRPEKTAEYKFHYHENENSAIEMANDGLILFRDAGEKITSLFNELCPEGYQVTGEDIRVEDLNPEEIEDVLILKNTNINDSEYIGEFFRKEGRWYYVVDEETTRFLSANEFASIWNTVLRGNDNGLS